MTTARDELYELAPEEHTPKPQHKEHKSSIKEEVFSALNDFSAEQQKTYEEAQQNERKRAIEQQQLIEEQEKKEASQAIKTSLQEEMSQDKEFAKLVRTSDLPGNLVELIGEVADAQEAPLIIRELAHNEEYQDTLKRSKSNMGKKKLLNKIRRDVITGGIQGNIPSILKKNIPNYNPNTQATIQDDAYYANLAVNSGIN
jgi:hypothetical protein